MNEFAWMVASVAGAVLLPLLVYVCAKTATLGVLMAKWRFHQQYETDEGERIDDQGKRT